MAQSSNIRTEGWCAVCEIWRRKRGRKERKKERKKGKITRCKIVATLKKILAGWSMTS